MKEYPDVSYRDLCDALNSLPRVMRPMRMRFIPHHSTLVKFAASVDETQLNRILAGTANMIVRNPMIAAIDATGFSCSDSSMHFIKRMKEMGIVVSSVRNYSKASLSVYTDILAVLACVTSDPDVHDIKHVPKLIGMMKDAGYDVDTVVADKGYDSEKVHEEFRIGLGAETVIPASVRYRKDSS